MTHYTLCLTCPLGLESIAKKEVEILGLTIKQSRDRVILFEGDDSAIAQINLWSRVGNKVYILLGESPEIDDFDGLYNFVYTIDWKKYISGNPIIVHAKSQASILTSTPTMQKIGKKAIVDRLSNKSGERVVEDANKQEIHIELTLIKNSLMVMLDTSGEGLHKRGYRSSAVEAPIRENLAAGIVLLSGWKFKAPLYDIFCGSGTIPIEAALIAKNIAPGIHRNFAYEKMSFIRQGIKEDAIKQAKEKVFEGKYTIIGSDIDAEAIKIAQGNAKRAGVQDDISFYKKEAGEYTKIDGTLVTNPPYGERLTPKNLHQIYITIKKLFVANPELTGGVITSYPFDLKERHKWKRRKLYNGGVETNFYKKSI